MSWSSMDCSCASGSIAPGGGALFCKHAAVWILFVAVGLALTGCGDVTEEGPGEPSEPSLPSEGFPFVTDGDPAIGVEPPSACVELTAVAKPSWETDDEILLHGTPLPLPDGLVEVAWTSYAVTRWDGFPNDAQLVLRTQLVDPTTLALQSTRSIDLGELGFPMTTHKVRAGTRLVHLAHTIVDGSSAPDHHEQTWISVVDDGASDLEWQLSTTTRFPRLVPLDGTHVAILGFEGPKVRYQLLDLESQTITVDALLEVPGGVFPGASPGLYPTRPMIAAEALPQGDAMAVVVSEDRLTLTALHISTAGQLVASASVVTLPEAGIELFAPELALLNDQTAALTWTGTRSLDVRLRLFDTSLINVEPSVGEVVNLETAGYQEFGRLTPDGSGGALLTWDNNGRSMSARHLDARGQLTPADKDLDVFGSCDSSPSGARFAATSSTILGAWLENGYEGTRLMVGLVPR